MVYLDDILIFSHTEEEHQKHVHMVFDRLAQFKYHVKRKKCELFSEKVEFLGHTVSAAGVGVVRPRLMLLSSGHSQYVSRMYRLS